MNRRMINPNAIAEKIDHAAKNGETGKAGHAVIEGGVIWTDSLRTESLQPQIAKVDFVPAPTTDRFELQM